MQFPIWTDAGGTGEAFRTPREPAAAGRSGEARAEAEGPRRFPLAAPVRFSAHKTSAVDGPFPETKQ
jgi:hypothetical protein